MCASNAESTLATAIESILLQTYREFEFVIVENGSTDGTWEIIASFKDPRIRAFRTEIRRLPFNLNFGLLQTRAKWVARMDADDIALPQRFERQMAFLLANPGIDVLGSSFHIFGNDFAERVIEMPTTDREIRKSLPFFLSLCHPTVVMRREKIISPRRRCCIGRL